MGGKCNHDRCPLVAGRSGYCDWHTKIDPTDHDADGHEDEAELAPAFEW